MVDNGVKFQRTTVAPAPGWKLLPLTINVKAPLLVNTESGLRLVITGCGGLMVTVALEELPVTLLTVTLPVPGLAVKAAGSVAVNCAALTQFVASAVVPHITMEAAVKFAPLIVSMRSPPPATIEAGFTEEIKGGEPAEK